MNKFSVFYVFELILSKKNNKTNKKKTFLRDLTLKGCVDNKQRTLVRRIENKIRFKQI